MRGVGLSQSFRLRALRQWRSIVTGGRPWISVVEMPGYSARAQNLLTELEQEAIVQMIAKDPTRGVLIEGTGGVRKMRFGAGRRGKSGGVRVVYYFHSEVMPAYLLSIFAKNEQADLPRAERGVLAGLVQVLKRSHRR